MASIKCNHCKSKFSYRSSIKNWIGNNSDHMKLLRKYPVWSIGNYYYCEPCIDWIGGFMKKEELPEPPPVGYTTDGIIRKKKKDPPPDHITDFQSTDEDPLFHSKYGTRRVI